MAKQSFNYLVIAMAAAAFMVLVQVGDTSARGIPVQRDLGHQGSENGSQNVQKRWNECGCGFCPFESCFNNEFCNHENEKNSEAFENREHHQESCCDDRDTAFCKNNNECCHNNECCDHSCFGLRKRWGCGACGFCPFESCFNNNHCNNLNSHCNENFENCNHHQQSCCDDRDTAFCKDNNECCHNNECCDHSCFGLRKRCENGFNRCNNGFFGGCNKCFGNGCFGRCNKCFGNGFFGCNRCFDGINGCFNGINGCFGGLNGCLGLNGCFDGFNRGCFDGFNRGCFDKCGRCDDFECLI